MHFSRSRLVNIHCDDESGRRPEKVVGMSILLDSFSGVRRRSLSQVEKEAASAAQDAWRVAFRGGTRDRSPRRATVPWRLSQSVADRVCYSGRMQTNLLASLSVLSDHDLLERVRSLTTREREATAALVAHLAELDERKLYLGEGYSSLFAYCTGALHLSDGEAGNRIEAARAARRFPVILERLADGSLHLTAVRLLAPHLTVENHEQVL
jgi:hypothetical protein